MLEQGVPVELEVDGLDAACEHYLARWEGAPVATARARATPAGCKIERVAVLAPYRQRALGTALIKSMLEDRPHTQTVYVHAQQAAAGFWTRLGFSAAGASFDEAGIPHQRMVRGPR